MKIYCRNTDEYIPIKGGESLSDIYNLIADRIGFLPIGALVNYKAENMGYKFFGPKMVEFFSRESEHGRRMYVRSLCMMLYYAVYNINPAARLRIVHSVAGGYYCRLTGIDVTPELVVKLRRIMKELMARDIPFTRKERQSTHVAELFRRQGLLDKVKLIEATHRLYTVYYELDDVLDTFYGELAPSTGHIDVFDLQPYKEGFILLSFDRDDPSRPAAPVEQDKMQTAFDEYVRFNEVIQVKNVAELYDVVAKNLTRTLIDVAEALHNKKISSIAEEITNRYNNGHARIVFIAGPSSSGKTTFTKRLAIQLITNLLMPRMISLDNYFVDRELTPKDIDGGYDYESLYAINIDRFNSDLNRLLNGEEVTTPRYDFKTGKSNPTGGEKMRLDKNTVLLIEGIHGLNPALTQDIDNNMIFKVYVSALTSLSIDDHNWIPTTDNRLLRRIIRDAKYRGASAVDTIHRWASVRRGEEKWIFPYQENADCMFNSSLLFEVGVVKDLAEQILRQIPHDVPEYSEAYRLLRFLSSFPSIKGDNIPSTSLLREFLGGSSFHY